MGRRVRQDILKEKRAEFGEEIVAALARQLEQEVGRGFSGKALHHMIRFAETFSDEQIVSALPRQLTWTHFKALIYSPDLPGCVATGTTREDTEKNMYEAIEMHIQGLREDNLPIPESTSSAEFVAVP